MKLVECVPNFSEGRDKAVIKQITDEIGKINGVKLLDVDPGEATNRTVVTFIGEPEPVKEAAFQAIKKAAELIDTLRLRGLPVILMGDFNTDWQAEDSALRLTAEALGLRAFQPHNADLHTFPTLGKRLDWILISEHFEFLSYAILPHGLSDHRGVMARLRLSLPASRAL